MTYPISDVDTSQLDAGTDSPAAARSSLLDLAQKFNAMRGFFNTFWQGVLATSSQASARAALDAVGTADTIAQAAHAATADAAGSADSVPWSGVSGRPTNVSAFTNDAEYLTAASGGGVTKFDSGNLTAATAAGQSLSYPHNLSSVPSMVRLVAVCVSANAGYAVGDEAELLINGMQNGNIQFKPWANVSHVGYYSGNAMVIINRTNGYEVPITNNDTYWKIKFYAWK